MENINIKYHSALAGYFHRKPLYLDEPTQKKPNTRKLVEQPWQQTMGELWEEVTDTLCNLDFIQAKAAAKMTYELVEDFNSLLLVIPDNAENIREEKARQERMDKYTRDLILYFKGEITKFEIPKSVIPWTEQQKKAEIERIKVNPTKVDRLRDFTIFLGREAINLQNYANKFAHLTTQVAWNSANEGPVGKSSEEASKEILNSLFLCTHSTRKIWEPLPQVLRVLKGHLWQVNAISTTPDGKLAFSGSGDNSCILWDLSTGRLIRTLKGHSNWILSTSITPDGKLAISGSHDHTCIIWDLSSGQILKTLKGHDNSVETVFITPDRKYAISGSGRTCVYWDLTTGQAIHILESNSIQIRAVTIIQNGKQAISFSMDNTCIFWDLITGQVIRKFRGGNDWSEAVSITSDGKLALCGTVDGIYNLWDLTNGRLLKIIKGPANRARAVSITPDGKRAITSSNDSTCIIWDLTTGKVLQTLKGHSNVVRSVSITPDGERAISGSLDNICILWDLKTGYANQTAKTNVNYVENVSITPHLSKDIFGFRDNTSILLNLKMEHLQQTQQENYNRNKINRITPDGTRKLVPSENNVLLLYDLVTGKVIQTLRGHSDKVYDVLITPDGKKAISWSKDWTCILWDLSTGQLIKILKGHKWLVQDVSITPDGKLAVSASEDHSCIIWDLISGEALQILEGHTEEVKVVSITPDGKRAISGSGDNNILLLGTSSNKDCIIVWDLKTGQVIQTLKGHSGIVTDVFITPDGKRAISCSMDCSCFLWNINTGTQLAWFCSDSKILRSSITPFGLVLNCYNDNKILCIDRKFLQPSTTITTIRYIWDFRFSHYQEPSADCPICGHRFAPPISVLNTIEKITKRAGLKPEQSPCLELRDEYWEDQGLMGNCPNCGEGLNFNPFIAGGDGIKPK